VVKEVGGLFEREYESVQLGACEIRCKHLCEQTVGGKEVLREGAEPGWKGRGGGQVKQFQVMVHAKKGSNTVRERYSAGLEISRRWRTMG